VSTAGTPCPRCGRPEVLDPGTGPAPQHCPGCGLELTPALTEELAYLDSVEAWAASRRAALLAGDSPPTGPAAPAAHPTPGRPRVTAAGALLATGAFALVVAGLAFTAVAWEFLGALGQLLVLVAVAVAALAAGRLLATRIPGTATALAITGSLLLVVAAGFLLSSEAAGPPWLRVVLTAGVAVAGVPLAALQARRQPVAGALSASVAAVLAVVAVALAPALPPASAEALAPRWAALVLVVGGSLIVLLTGRSAPLLPALPPWAGLGTVLLVLGTVVGAVATADAVSARAVSPPTVAAAVLALGSLLPLLLDRLTGGRRWTPAAGATLLLGLAGLLGLVALLVAEQLGWVAALGAVVAGIALVARALLAPYERSDARFTGVRHLLSSVALRIAALAAGAGLAAAAAIGVEAETAVLRAALTGLAVGGLAVAVALATRRIPGSVDVPLLAAGAAALAWPVVLGSSAPLWVRDAGAELGRALGIELVVAAVAVLAVLVALRFPVATWWIATGVGSVGAGVVVTAYGDLDLPARPELTGLVIAVLPALTALLLVSRRATTSSWVWAPALLAALAPSVLAVVGDAAEGGYAAGVTGPEDVLRLVGLLVVATVLVALGARHHLAGVFWPALGALVVVVASQLMSLAVLAPQWISLTLLGAVLVTIGARWEWVRTRGHRTREWAAALH
jgi:hypothetical protein